MIRGLLAVLMMVAFSVGCSKSDKASSNASESQDVVIQTIQTKSGVEMLLIPAGEFIMGSDDGLEDEAPVRKVAVDKFLIDKYEVTQESFQNITGKNPSKFKAPQNPVEQVSWYDAAINYCNMRSLREKLTPCYDGTTEKCNFEADGYRLPTEAEWEYACRAGTTTKYFFGKNSNQLAKYGWTEDNSGETTHAVGSKEANPWGLFDMYGNVLEWCNDAYNEEGYSSAGLKNPHGPESGEKCVLRGGSWDSPNEESSSTSRASETRKFSDACFGANTYGFRCVKKAPVAAE